MNKFQALEKYIYQKITGKVSHLKKGVNCKKKWYGSSYGGFYVHPEILNENSIIYSVGIGQDISFGLQLIKEHNCHVWGFDPTPESIIWMDEQKLPDNYHFLPYGLFTKTGPVKFYMPIEDTHISCSATLNDNVSDKTYIDVPMKSFEDILLDTKHTHIDVLKIDIEGAEYEVMDSIIKSDASINQILIEFHDRYIKNGKEKTIEVINALKNKGYEIFGISSTFEEISFIKKELVNKNY